MSLPIDHDALATYLNDHLAASVGALDLFKQIEEAHASDPIGRELAPLRAALEEDQQLLRAIIESIGATESSVRQAAAWLGEQVARIKLGPDTDSYSGLKLLEAFDVLALGFGGRSALWRTLAHLRFDPPAGSSADFSQLAARVQQHMGVMERLRLEAAVRALTSAAI